MRPHASKSWPAARLARGLAGQLPDVGPGREGPRPGAGQDDRPARLVGVQAFQRVRELAEKVEAERVERLRAGRA